MVKLTPPLGWNSWNTFGLDINEKIVLDAADAMVREGLRDAGYEYIVIDDCWQLPQRDENGFLVPNPERFPHGMKYVADYVHEKGLKFGMYSCAGYLTCQGLPASYEYEWKDAKTFAEWGVDYLKYDFCYHPRTVEGHAMYKRMGLALANCGRDIYFSACSWGQEYTREWIRESGANSWRSTWDIVDSWKSIKDIAVSQLQAQQYNAPGCFDDMDMLVVGMNGKGLVGVSGCTTEEYRTHFSLWALLGSPLMLGCDIANMTPETKEIVMNREVLAINQDLTQTQPFIAGERRIVNENRAPNDSFYKPFTDELTKVVRYLSNGDIAIGLFNLTDSKISKWGLTVNGDELGIPATSGKTLIFRDVWTGEEFGMYNGMLVINDSVEAHACRLLRARVVDKQ